MRNRAQIDLGGNYVRAAVAGDATLDQLQINTISTAGSGVLTAAAMLGGIIQRTGPGANYADALDSADNLMAAAPLLAPGDSFLFWLRNTVAFTNTVAVGEGAELGTNTSMIASNVRMYLLTVLATARRRVYQVTSVNGSPTITGLTPSQVALLQPGMGVSGTGMPASGTIIGVNINAGSVTLSGNATADGTPTVTFFPRYVVQGIHTAAL